jgi:hypothetical protein
MDLRRKQAETRAAWRTASPNAGKGMLYPEMWLRRRKRNKDRRSFAGFELGRVTSHRRYGEADSEPGKAGTTRSNTRRK